MRPNLYAQTTPQDLDAFSLPSNSKTPRFYQGVSNSTKTLIPLEPNNPSCGTTSLPILPHFPGGHSSIEKESTAMLISNINQTNHFDTSYRRQNIGVQKMAEEKNGVVFTDILKQHIVRIRQEELSKGQNMARRQADRISNKMTMKSTKMMDNYI